MSAIFIVGTTGTGKTKLALMLSQETPSVIISADSRQVYREMDIVTGKDHPKNIDIKGVDLVNPSVGCSVSQWYDSVKPYYVDAIKEGKQVIVVGGTGFYIRALTTGIDTMDVAINHELRAKLEGLSVSELQEILKQKDLFKFNSLNHSDQLNPRRLVRAVEVASSDQSSSIYTPPASSDPLVGLYYSDLEIQKKMIKKRVVLRLEAGAIKETTDLLSKYGPSSQGMTALGYAHICRHLKGELSLAELIEQWTDDELKYVKRQLTYFRKLNVVWYDRGRMSIEEIYDHLSR